MTEAPIVEIRVVNYRWMEEGDHGQVVDRVEHRFEIRRQGETEWTEIPVVELMAFPP